MALNLSFSSITQSNDNTILRLIDGTGVYSSSNLGGWGAPNTALSTINGTTNALSITISITTSDGVETIYTPIDVYTYLGHTPLNTDDLLFYITAADLKVIGESSAIGTNEDALPDGWYSITYELTVISSGASISTHTEQVLIDGIVRNKLYDKLITIPRTTYESTPLRVYVNNWDELTYPLYVLSLFEAMIAYVTPSRKNEILDMLNLIERLIS